MNWGGGREIERPVIWRPHMNSTNSATKGTTEEHLVKGKRRAIMKM